MENLMPVFDRFAPAGPSAVYGGTDARNPLFDPYRPMPVPATGELKIDPDIELKAKKFNLNISFFYSSLSDIDYQYGRGRGASVGGYALSHTSGGDTDINIVRGDFTSIVFAKVGT